MATAFSLEATDAKRLIVEQQGLRKSNSFGRGESALLNCITRLGYIQIDTISVINRAHSHTFWTRVPSFQESQLDDLQKDRKIFEYWSHAAAFLPMQDYRFCLPYMNAVASGQKHWRVPDKKLMKKVLARIRDEGPLSTREFEARTSSKTGLWGGHKPAKFALEQLFIEGQLVISHREGFRKVYDLPERVLPSELNQEEPSEEEFCRYQIDRTIQSQGIATVAEMSYLRKGVKKPIQAQLQQMLNAQEIVSVEVEDNPETYFSYPSLVEKSHSSRITPKVHLLSPFDNLVIQRKRAIQLFDFDYKIECYLPEKKRTYGYFCLPILFGDELVGRLDPKADRKSGKLLIRNLVLEKPVDSLKMFSSKLAEKLTDLASFNGCESIQIEKCNHRQLWASLKKATR